MVMSISQKFQGHGVVFALTISGRVGHKSRMLGRWQIRHAPLGCFGFSAEFDCGSLFLFANATLILHRSFTLSL